MVHLDRRGGRHGPRRQRGGPGDVLRLAQDHRAVVDARHNPAFWRKRGSEAACPRRQAQTRDNSHRRRASHKSDAVRSESVRHQSVRLDDTATYRTMCVRLCDGYFWPVSLTVTKREFARDSEVCDRSCGSPAVLHVYRNPGQEPQDMVDLKGQPYAKLGTAFRYRVSYDSACKCRPHPWERHRVSST